MRMEHLKEKVNWLRSVLEPFGDGRRGKKGGALYIGKVPPFIIYQNSFENAIDLLKRGPQAFEEEAQELFQKLGTPIYQTTIYLDCEGLFYSKKTHEWPRSFTNDIVYALRIDHDGWSHAAKKFDGQPLALNIKW